LFFNAFGLLVQIMFPEFTESNVLVGPDAILAQHLSVIDAHFTCSSIHADSSVVLVMLIDLLLNLSMCYS